MVPMTWGSVLPAASWKQGQHTDTGKERSSHLSRAPWWPGGECVWTQSPRVTPRLGALPFTPAFSE